jgi:hypothetical protein
MHQPPHRTIAILASRCRFRRPRLATLLFGARILVAFAIPPLAFAHEVHPADPPAGLSGQQQSADQRVAIVNAAGPIRQLVDQSGKADKRYLVIASGDAAMPGEAVQIETR